MQKQKETPVAGQMVIVRNRPGVVRDVQSSGGETTEGVLHFVDVEYIDGWSHPESDGVIWEREMTARTLGGPALPRIDDANVGIDDPDRFRAFIDANRWGSVARIDQLVSSSDGGTADAPIVSAWHSAVQIEDYQIYPVLKSLLMPRVALLLADDVGLGKTIEAGLIVTELFSRRRIRRVLIICPASLQRQWRDEMHEKFHLDFNIINRDETFRLQRELGVDVNPWTSFPRIITSMDYLSQPDILEQFRSSAKGLTSGNGVLLPWDLLIVDEAHNFSPSMFNDETRRCAMLREMRNYFEHRLFLTATPHNGYTVSFSGLLELLDPVRFHQSTELTTEDHAQIRVAMVRRLKSELNRQGVFKRFSNREVKAINIPRFHQKEAALFDALKEYKKTGNAILSSMSDKEKNLGRFVFTLLTKRLLSSAYAFARTWHQHTEGFDLEQVDFEQADHAKKRAETDMSDDAEKDRREEDAARQTGSWINRLGGEMKKRAIEVNRCLADLGWTADIIAKAASDPSGRFPGVETLPPDSKWDELVKWVEGHMKDGRTFRKDERVILFTEYKHTLDYLMHRFKKTKIEEPVIQELFGGASLTSRETIKEEFNDPDSPLRILVATDTASEGLNLQNSCRYVIHQEIPWNPMRLEQRNGRVDRHGQLRDVFVFHFSCDDDDDMKFLSRVVTKVNQIREDLGSVGQVIDQALMLHFNGKTFSTDDFELKIDAIKRESDEERDLTDYDSGDKEDYEKALRNHAAAEISLGINPDSMARLLQEAMSLEKGDLESTGETGVYRIVRIPPAWEGLVNDTIRLKSRQSAMPKIVFDPSYFEERVSGRTVFRPKKDVMLLRLGHPVMRRATGVLKRRMWDHAGKRDVNRWTVTGSALPTGLECVMVVYHTLQAVNTLRENIHSEVCASMFKVAGDRLSKMDEALVAQITALPTHKLGRNELSPWESRLRKLWLPHEEQIKTFLLELKKELKTDFDRRMKEFFSIEKSSRKTEFDNRIKEIEKQKHPKAIERLMKQRDEQRKRLSHGILFADIQAEEEQKLRDIEWNLINTHVEQLKELLSREKERIVNGVLPKRFTLESVDIHPLAVEYIVKSKEGGRS
ncbi:MAG TPA: DISARM system SNF2-like helicase DrmD [bacterium]|nr:DISARM system SNF2-like helicase DrmD [bacterium]